MFSISVSAISIIAIAAMNVKQEENHPPVVKILSPKEGGSASMNGSVHYTVNVADKEDGDSKYDEITANEVLLTVRYLKDTSALRQLRSSFSTDPGLAGILRSNCLNCHAFNAKLIGPSFAEISKRYSAAGSVLDKVASRIHDGSTGIWGNVTMPTHPELSAAQCRKMVDWIVNAAARPGVNYFTGTEGNVRLNAPPGTSYVSLSASYTDHSENGHALTGGHVIVLPVGK